MVRSRSETNLNKIFLNLCTSPEVRSKYDHSNIVPQRSHRPLQPIKSNSCSDLTDLCNTQTQQSSINDKTEQDTLDLTVPHSLPILTDKKSNRIVTREYTRLVPLESTGFTVQTDSTVNNTPLPSHQECALHNSHSDKNKSKLSSIMSTKSSTKYDHDYTQRLRQRLVARKHLRKFFLS